MHKIEVVRRRQEPSSENESDEDQNLVRTGTTWTCVAHIITAVIGAGVLSLSWSVAQLGWIAGPCAMLIFALVTCYSAFLLADCYRSPDPVTGRRNRTYMDAVRVNLGKKQIWFCGLLQYINMFGIAVAYVITTGISMRAILKSNCYHFKGRDAPCDYGVTFYMVMFGLLQIVCSQIPDLHNLSWLSIVAAIMSLSYSFLGFGLGLAKVVENKTVFGSIEGVPGDHKAWKISQALGDIAFSFPYSILVLEIQDTLKSPPAEKYTMKKASVIAVCITTFFYLCCGCFGYAAFGDDTPGNLLTGFGFYEPFWLVDLANACIIVHLIGGYQVFSQPVFAFMETWISSKFPSNLAFMYKSFAIPIPFSPTLHTNLLRLCVRTTYVVATTGLAVLFPYFNDVLGVLGALSFWPLAIYFPVEMYFVQMKIEKWCRKWIMMQTFSIVCFVVALFALVGSIQGLIANKLR